jgi:hypothetical protein
MSSPETQAGFWDLFDAVYCVSLKSRGDRRRAVARRFARVGLGDRFAFWDATECRENPYFGCWESHMALMRHAVRNGIERLLVFEDDVLFTRAPSEADLRAVATLLDAGGWNVIQLGCKPFHLAATAIPSLYRSRALDAHAYAVNLGFMRRIQDARFAKRIFPIGPDCVFLISAGAFALAPMLCTQDDTYSDIERCRPRRDGRDEREATCLQGGVGAGHALLKGRLLAVWAWNQVVIRLANPGLDLSAPRPLPSASHSARP